MKGGIVYSNYVNAISLDHVWEARFGNEGYEWVHILEIHQQKFGGILNRLDYNIWSPNIDSYIIEDYNFEDFELKAHNKKALREPLLLQDKDKPIIVYIGLLDAQKGVYLIN